MARIAGVDIPRDKKVNVALTYIYGVGPTVSQKVLERTNVGPDTRVKDLTDALRLAARLNASDKASELSPIAGALAAEIMGSVRPFGAVDLEVRVAVAGSTADGTVTVYHCEGSSAAAAEFKELASRKVTVGDRFDWVLARQPQFASSSRDLARLTAALVSGLESLADRF